MVQIGTPAPGGAPVFSASPTTGGTVNFPASNMCCWLNPAGTLATLTVNLPADNASRIGDVCSVGSEQIITVLTIGGATLVYNTVTALAVGDLFVFKKVKAGTWARFAQ